MHSTPAGLTRRGAARGSRGWRPGLILGPTLALVVAVAPGPEGLTVAGQRGLAVLVLCVVWWLLTPVALPVTSLLGLALLPLLRVLDPTESMRLFGNQAVFFVIGVFLVAAAMVRSGLSTRLALWILRWLARSEDLLSGAVLVLSAALCVLVVSHAVAALMLPIVLGMIDALDLGPRSRTARRLLLSMAWGTSIGSNLTLFASARAALSLELLQNHLGGATVPVGFLQYSAATSAVCLLLVVLAFLVLKVVLPSEGIAMEPAIERLDLQVAEIGAVSAEEWKTAAVIAAMVPALVVLGPQVGLGTVALLFSTLLFVLRVLDWESAERFVNWGIVLLYGGAIAIGAGLERSGAIGWFVDLVLPSGGASPTLVMVLVAGLSVLLTQFVANAAVIALVLPAVLVVCPTTGLDPRSVTVVMAVATGMAFALPVSTPAMAMVHGTGYIGTRDGIAHGVVITLLAIPVLLAVVYLWWPVVGLGPMAG